jgi:uncharacterized protein YidB (DUF937 family)
MGMFESLVSTAASSLMGQGQASGGQAALVNGAIALLSQQGGISGLLEKFNAQGLGHLVESWVSSGQNLPISADQIKSVLGEGALQHIASSTGQDTGAVANGLSALLPDLINKLTPQGTVPQGGFDAGSALSLVQGLFSKA